VTLQHEKNDRKGMKKKTKWRKAFGSEGDRVARWYIFVPKNPNLGKFWRAKE
jgi:hypothetical protein